MVKIVRFKKRGFFRCSPMITVKSIAQRELESIIAGTVRRMNGHIFPEFDPLRSTYDVSLLKWAPNSTSFQVSIRVSDGTSHVKATLNVFDTGKLYPLDLYGRPTGERYNISKA
jgi:hypothetical protein